MTAIGDNRCTSCLLGWRRTALLGGVVLLLGMAVYWLPRQSQPVHQGKNVAQWFDEMRQTGIGLQDGQPAGHDGPPVEALQAFLHLGGDAVPYLTKVARCRPTLVSRRYGAVVSRLPTVLQRWLPGGHSDSYYEGRQERALVILGSLVYWQHQPRPLGLSQSKVSADSVIPAIRDGLGDPLPPVRNTAAQAAACLKAGASPLVPDLVRLLIDTNSVIRLSAVTALGQIGPSASNAVAAIESLLHSSEVLESQAAAKALGRIGVPARAAAVSLAHALAVRDAGTRQFAARSLYQVGFTPLEAIPALRGLTDQSNLINIRQAASLALWNLDRQDSALLGTVSNLILQQPLTGLYELKESSLDRTAFGLVPTLSGLTNHRQPSVRQKAVLALREIEGQVP